MISTHPTLSPDEKFQRLFRQETLFRSLINARARFGSGYQILEDAEHQPLNYEDLITRSYALGQKIKSATQIYEHAGILLPNSIAAVVCFFALQAYARVPTLLNFSAGSHSVLMACQLTTVKRVYTSRRFVEAAKLAELILKLQRHSITIVYLEDVVKAVNFVDKLMAKLKSKIASVLYKRIERHGDPKQEAVILFTSGSEGAPKGVALSHLNIQANSAQALASVEIYSHDILFNILPLFHSFGLNAGLLLPLLSGVKTFLYPSPLHYQLIPSLIRKTKATLLFGTDTFLQAYAHYATQDDFVSLRLVFAGAEKLKESTRLNFAEKFSIQVFEGYGLTEASPILSLNTPQAYKAGSVGRFLAGISYQLIPVPGINGQRLLVKGANIMLGYYSYENLGKLNPVLPYHETGDIVSIDDEGFVTLIGRAKRFAKIAGEMISLHAVEQFIHEIWPDSQHAVLTEVHPRHGESLVLVTDQINADRSHIIHYAAQQGFAELMCPKRIIHLNNIPLLAGGKINYPELQSLLEKT